MDLRTDLILNVSVNSICFKVDYQVIGINVVVCLLWTRIITVKIKSAPKRARFILNNCDFAVGRQVAVSVESHTIHIQQIATLMRYRANIFIHANAFHGRYVWDSHRKVSLSMCTYFVLFSIRYHREWYFYNRRSYRLCCFNLSISFSFAPNTFFFL